MSILGPGKTGCSRLALSDTVNLPVNRLQFFLQDNAVSGAQLATSSRTGNMGNVSSTDTIEYRFTKETPLVGIYGYSSATSINGVGVIRFDVVCQAEKDKERKLLEDIAVQKLTKESENEEGEEEGGSGAMVGIIAGAAALVILVTIIAIVIICKRK